MVHLLVAPQACQKTALYEQVRPPKIEISLGGVFLLADTPSKFFSSNLIYQGIFTSWSVYNYFFLPHLRRLLKDWPVDYWRSHNNLLFFLFFLLHYTFSKRRRRLICGGSRCVIYSRLWLNLLLRCFYRAQINNNLPVSMLLRSCCGNWLILLFVRSSWLSGRSFSGRRLFLSVTLTLLGFYGHLSDLLFSNHHLWQLWSVLDDFKVHTTF